MEKTTVKFGIKYWIAPAFVSLLNVILIIIGIFLFIEDELSKTFVLRIIRHKQRKGYKDDKSSVKRAVARI